jgi:hypothetical protein
VTSVVELSFAVIGAERGRSKIRLDLVRSNNVTVVNLRYIAPRPTVFVVGSSELQVGISYRGKCQWC